MEEDANDLAILRLALMYERAYERFVHDLATHTVHTPEARRALAALEPPTGDHSRRIAEELARLHERLAPSRRSASDLAALLDVRAVEEAARDFYLRYADLLHDPALGQLFREMAREEDEHARVAERALAQVEGAHDEETRREAEALRLLRDGEGALLLREGVSDFGGKEARPRT